MMPFVHVNCAMSADGKIAGPERKQVRISSDEDIQRVKGLRLQYDAILVGVGTIISDDPHLTVKGRSYEENPIRIVLDPNGRTPDDSLVLDGRAPTVIVTSSDCTREWRGAQVMRSRRPMEQGPEVSGACSSVNSNDVTNISTISSGVNFSSHIFLKSIDLRGVLEHLADEGIESILVEGGGETIASFFREGLVDRYTVFVGGMVIGGKDSPTPADGPCRIGTELKLLDSRVSGNGVIITFDVVRPL
jgi:Pyrimidine reductase, riboflavin biosynthesis